MLNLHFALLAQYPAFFLLAVICLINYLSVRKRSAVKSILWVILFGLSLAVSILFCFLGIQAKYWTPGTLFKLSVWSWIGIALVLAAVIVRFAFGVKNRLDQRRLARELKKAEQDKAAAVAQAREEARAEAAMTAAAGTAPDVVPAPQTEADGNSPADLLKF